MTLLASGASAVLAPSLIGGFLQNLPGGPIAVILGAAALIWLGTRMNDGIAKAVTVGAGAGILTISVLGTVFGQRS